MRYSPPMMKAGMQMAKYRQMEDVGRYRIDANKIEATPPEAPKEL
jgi:hypothetical protein